MAVGNDVLNAPFPQLVTKLGMAIAEAQSALDRNSIETLLELSDTASEITVPLRFTEDASGNWTSQSATMTLLQFGINPTFYQFSESVIEVKIAISMTKTKEVGVTAKGKIGFACWSASVNASYSQKYSYKAEASSLLRTTLVPVPPPPRLIPEFEPYSAPED
ncbi:MAG: hypothetical protein ISS52_02970 [Dehalococcoidia bacterium]|nr:hypothetical protein [Dehalococcoidia bacterium]